jgi:serine/threonine-protein kinase
MLEPSARSSRELRQRLEREARVLAGVTSRHVGRLLGYGWEGEQPFLVLELLHGETLAEVLKREGKLPLSWLTEWIEQLLVGVRDCHAAGIIHRDIKPANIFLVRTEGGETFVKLIDFGVARLKEVALQGVSLTSTHHLIGSMGYMAPEQLEYAKGVGPEADLYAVGVVLFRCVSGRLPFLSRSFDALSKLKCETDAPKLSSMPGVNSNPQLDEFVAKALAREPEQRFKAASEMLEAWWRVCATVNRDTPLGSSRALLIDVPVHVEEPVESELGHPLEYPDDDATLIEFEDPTHSHPAPHESGEVEPASLDSGGHRTGSFGPGAFEAPVRAGEPPFDLASGADSRSERED